MCSLHRVHGYSLMHGHNEAVDTRVGTEYAHTLGSNCWRAFVRSRDFRTGRMYPARIHRRCCDARFMSQSRGGCNDCSAPQWVELRSASGPPIVPVPQWWRLDDPLCLPNMQSWDGPIADCGPPAAWGYDPATDTVPEAAAHSTVKQQILLQEAPETHCTVHTASTTRDPLQGAECAGPASGADRHRPEPQAPGNKSTAARRARRTGTGLASLCSSEQHDRAR